MNKGILVTDFDGVICNSLGECIFSSYNAYYKLEGGHKEVKGIEEIDNSLKSDFSKARSYIKSGEDYLLLWKFLKQNVEIKDQESFDELRNINKRFLVRYQNALDTERKHLLKKNKKLWLDLNPLFEAGVFLKQVKNFDSLYILSTKKKKYILEILKHHNIFFPESHIIYAKSYHKIDNLGSLLKKTNSMEKSYFIEDQVDFLINAKRLGVKRFLVDWGHVCKEQKKRAKQEEIEIINNKKFKKILENFIS